MLGFALPFSFQFTPLKLALHRSVIFWSGILVMGFIVWAASDSMSYSSQGALGRLALYNHGRGVVVVPTNPGTPKANYWGRTSFVLISQGREVPTFPRPMFVRGRGLLKQPGFDTKKLLEAYESTDFWKGVQLSIEMDDPAYWLLVIPHWLLLLAVVIPWTALMLWRARRRKRAIEKNPGLVPS